MKDKILHEIIQRYVYAEERRNATYKKIDEICNWFDGFLIVMIGITFGIIIGGAI